MCISQFISIYPDLVAEEDEFFRLRVGAGQHQTTTITMIADERAVGTAHIESCPQTQEISIGSQLIFTPPSCYDNSNNFVEASTCNPPSESSPSTSAIVTCHCRLQPTLQCTFVVIVSQERISPCPKTQLISFGRRVVFSPPSCYDSNGNMYSSICNPSSGTFFTTCATVTCLCSLQPSLQCTFDVTLSQENEVANKDKKLHPVDVAGEFIKNRIDQKGFVCQYLNDYIASVTKNPEKLSETETSPPGRENKGNLRKRPWTKKEKDAVHKGLRKYFYPEPNLERRIVKSVSKTKL
ncbi:hypothetical protein HOLleu_42360 [Holothuria leucospilota]|uniref:Uncharacterized protein n=1 Tax=Holothuria leucospilota TaxID=206669 RepID=A0A9Q1BC76_HOLLE|nr:hypothetical protein HOLleu_42360 [Holothuria leucospilota]